MCYITAVFGLAVVLLAASRTPCICPPVSFHGAWCPLVRSRSWFVLEMFLPRHAVHTMSAVCRMGISVVFLAVHDCVVDGIALVVGVWIRFLVPMVRFLVSLLHNPPMGRVSLGGIPRATEWNPSKNILASTTSVEYVFCAPTAVVDCAGAPYVMSATFLFRRKSLIFCSL